MAYTSKTDVESYLNTTIPSGARTDWLNIIIAAVKLWIDKYVGKTFEGASETRYYDGNGKDTLIIDDFTGTPTIKFLNDDGTEESTLGTDDYVLYPLNGAVKNTIYLNRGYAPYSRFTNDNRRISVTASFGHSASVPSDIKLAATILSAKVFNSGSSDGVVSSESLGDYSISYKTLDEEAKTLGVTSILDQYRILDI